MSGAAPGTTSQHAVEALRRALVTGSLKPGDRVRQEEIAESLGVSIGPVREALATLEQEGQLTYLPRRGYWVTELDVGDLQEIYELRALLESRAARRAMPLLDEDAMQRIDLAARACLDAAAAGDVAAELVANRRFHLAILESPDQNHTLRVIRLLWDSTETYRALYYNSAEGRQEASEAHERILTALHARDVELLVAELDAHRGAALKRLARVLAGSEEAARFKGRLARVGS